MADYLYIGSTPADEPCEQVGENFNRDRARAECRAYINQLIRRHGQPPEGGGFKIMWEQHDFGSYPEVVVVYGDSEASRSYGFKAERDTPEYWDAEALAELKASGLWSSDEDR